MTQASMVLAASPRYSTHMRKAFPKFAALVAALLLAPWLAAAERKAVPSSAPRLALVIGNANYATLGRLANPGQDAQLMADRLKALGFEVTEKRDRGLKEMSEDVEQFSS